jgi:hypothetical protein
MGEGLDAGCQRPGNQDGLLLAESLQGLRYHPFRRDSLGWGLGTNALEEAGNNPSRTDSKHMNAGLIRATKPR